MNEINIDNLKSEISKRLNYESGSAEQNEYDKKLNYIKLTHPYGEGPVSDNDYRYLLQNLENEKYKNIKIKHTKEDNDKFLDFLEANLFIINNQIDSKSKELETLKKKNNKFIDRNLNFLNHKIKKEPSYNQQINQLENDKYKLNSVKTDIKKLVPIYKPPPDSVHVTGGYKKEKDRKSQKMYTIGKRYKLLSKNSYHISGTPYAETRVFDGMEDGYYVFYMPSNPKIRYKYKPGLWIIKPCSSIKTKKDKCRKFRRTKRRT